MSVDPFDALSAAPRGEPVVLLHSCGEGPATLFRSPLDVCRVTQRDVATAFTALEAFLDAHAEHACAGFLGYDLRDAVEPLPRRIPADPDETLLCVAAFAEVDEWPAAPPPPPVPAAPGGALRLHVARAEHERRVARVVEHIRAGDVFQANLTQPFSAPFDGDPRALFRRLCAVSPAPFAAYVEDGRGTAVVSSSPEEFLLVEGDLVRTRPIKGTRGRDPDPARDAALLRELLESPKDDAELTMIVDLLRNDLGKVAVPGSVAVGPFPEHATFAAVHHLFATVSARLRPDVGLVDVLRATFPGGSITGAPKLRCMEILEALESERRGVYTGAIGRFGPGQRMHLNIAIRTMTVRDGVARFDAGGGITADSEPVAEYDETLHKALGLARALGVELPPLAGR